MKETLKEDDRPSFKKRENENLIVHAKRVEAMWKKASAVHESHGIEFCPTSYLFLWRNKRQLLETLTRASKSMLDVVVEAPIVEEWRSSTPKNRAIVREILILLSDKKTVTLSEAEVACQEHAGRESVRTCLNLGVDLHCLEKTGVHYAISDSILEESVNRLSIKMTDPHILKMCEIIVSYNTYRQLQMDTYALEKKTPLPQDSPPTLHEAIHSRGINDSGDYYKV
tara:strand:- start:77 stop:754 length:678 start_codon:yes stop_codon:yes gene_type:complete